MSKSGLQILFLFAALCVACVPAFGDGGTLQLRKSAGPFTITVFSAPVPLRVGIADLSVLVQDAEENVLDDGIVTLQLSKPGEAEIVAEATTGQATNKLLYTARADLPEAGSWRLRVEVRRDGVNAVAEGAISVLPQEPPLFTYWLYFAVVPLGVILYVLNQWLKRKQGYTRGRRK